VAILELGHCGAKEKVRLLYQTQHKLIDIVKYELAFLVTRDT